MFLLVNEGLFCIRQRDSCLRKKLIFFSYFKSEKKCKNRVKILIPGCIIETMKNLFYAVIFTHKFQYFPRIIIA